MSNIWEILHKPDTVVFFDIDGTLTSYNYGKHHAHHELDGTLEFRDVNIYADCKRLKPLYDYISGHDVTGSFAHPGSHMDMKHGNQKWLKDFMASLHPIAFTLWRPKKNRRLS